MGLQLESVFMPDTYIFSKLYLSFNDALISYVYGKLPTLLSVSKAKCITASILPLLDDGV